MGKLCITIKLRYVLSLLFILVLSVLLYSCSRVKEQNIVAPANVVAGQALGTVSISIYNTLGIKDEERIARQLELEAQKIYPGSRAIINIRYGKSTAYADVIE